MCVIYTIYLLGFRLNEVETSVFKLNRQYVDLITNTIIEQKSDFIENGYRARSTKGDRERAGLKRRLGER